LDRNQEEIQMSKQCEHIKADGEQCRGAAIWGSEPPRCPVHRLDGGPRGNTFEGGHQFGRLNIKHGYFSRKTGGGPALEERAARCLLTEARLRALLAREGDERKVMHYFLLFGRNLSRLLRLLDEYEQATGHHPDRLLQQAGGEPLAAIQADLAAVRDTARNDYPATVQRSPRYWRVYETIVEHIEKYHVAPTWRQIRNSCGIPTNSRVAYWVDRLEEDGLIIRRPGPRGIDLPDEPAEAGDE
jgi:hypothetical protein